MVSKEVKSKTLKIVVSVLVLLLISGLSLVDDLAPEAGYPLGVGAPPAGVIGRMAPDSAAGYPLGGGSSGPITGNENSGQVMSGRSVKNDISPRLRDIRPLPPRGGGAERDAPENHALPPDGKRAGLKDPVAQKWFGLFSMPAPTANFAGIGFLGFAPPDSNGDAGPNHYVQWVNSSFEIFSKAGVPVYGPAAGNTLWTGFGGPCETTNDGDPIVLYDQIAGRWFMSQFANVNSPGPFYQCIALSINSDPLSSYYRYAFQISPNLLNDYPKFGVWPDAYYMSTANFNGTTYVGPSAVAFNRNAMLAGQPATYQKFDLPSSVSVLLPSDLDGSAMPPAGSANIFATIAPTSNVTLRRFHVDWNTPANSTLSTPITLTVAPFNQVVGFVSQPGAAMSLDSMTDRPMYRLAYRNFGDHESLVFNHTVNADPNGSIAGVRWYELRGLSGTPTVYQQGTYAPDFDGRWMGSIAMDHMGNIALGYSVSGSSTYPSIRYTGRLTSDPLGTLPQGEASLAAGNFAQTGSYRWGDYSSMSVDPTDDCTFWYTQEYVGCCSGHADTRIGAFKFPSCTSSGTATPSSTPNSTLTPTSTVAATRTSTPTVTPTLTPTSTPPTADAFAYLHPTGPLTVTVGSKITLDLRINGGSSSVAGAQSYLTFTNALLLNVDASAPGCTLTDTVRADTSTFDTVLQNQACNSSAPCTFGEVVAPPGSLAFSSGVLINPPASGSFRVAQVAFCAAAAGTALVHWQFSPPAPEDRDSQVVDSHSNNVRNAALYSDLVVNVVATPPATTTPTATPNTTVTPTPSATSTNTPGLVLVGHVNWQGPPAQPSTRQQLPITLTLCVSGTPAVYGATTDSSGFFTVTTALPSGSYNWRAKGPKYLATSGTVPLSGGGTTQLEMGLQRAGDTDATHNNVVNISDFNVLKGVFGTASSFGDLNNDAVTNITDFNLLRGNFGTAGAAANCP